MNILRIIYYATRGAQAAKGVKERRTDLIAPGDSIDSIVVDMFLTVIGFLLFGALAIYLLINYTLWCLLGFVLLILCICFASF